MADFPEPQDRELEAEVEAALARKTRERRSMAAREFVSERDALETAWGQSDAAGVREEGW